MKDVLFTGAGVALVTPFKDDSSVNFDELERLIEFQIDNGTDAIITCGTTGEAKTLSSLEHTAVIDFTVKKVNGRVPVIAGTGSNDTRYAIDLSNEAKSLGVDGLLLVTPYYNKTSQRGLIQSFNLIADSVKMPCILYNVPTRTGVNIQPQTYYELSKNPYIVATKEANGDVSSLVKTMELCGDDLAIYSGEDVLTYPIISMGGKGVISVFSNVLPREMHEFTKAALEGRTEEARSMMFRYVDLMNALFMDVNPIPVKAAMNMMGFDVGECRLPLVRMSEEGRKNLMNELAKIDRVIGRELPDASRETLLVLDSTTGQNAVVQAAEFSKATGITGIVLTKLDGTAKGGVVLAIKDGLQIPVKYIGVGEQVDDLQPFSPSDFAKALFDRGEA